MEISSDVLREIAARAATLEERRSPCFIPDTAPAGQALAHERLAHWRHLAADDQRFADCLARDSLDCTAALGLLAPQRLRADAPLPDWAAALAAALQTTTVMLAAVERCREPQRPLPFEDLLLPFVAWAALRLRAQAGAADRLLGEAAQIALERWLLVRLCEAALPVLVLERDRYRAAHGSALATLLDGADTARVDAEFVDTLRDATLLGLFCRYSTLARLLVTIAELWVSSGVELLARLVADDNAIQAYFAAHTGRVVQLKLGRSDPHDGGRCVVEVAWESGLCLVYKPRDLGMEHAFYELLRWCNQRGLRPALATLGVLDRGTHGWVEFAPQRPCAHIRQIRRYYRRAGMLLGLVHALWGTDCHAENLIAMGDQPLLVDAEMLLYPPEASEMRQSPGQLCASLLRTGLLPFGEHAAAPAGLPHNADARRAMNAPLLNDRPQLANDHVDTIVAGFRAMDRFLGSQRDALLAAGGPLAAMARQPLRYALRPTSLYAALLARLAHPRYLQEAIDRDIECMALCRAFYQPEQRLALWPLLRYERRALAQLDIPRIMAHPDHVDLATATGERSAGSLAAPGASLVAERLRRRDRHDRALQIACIRESLPRRWLPPQAAPARQDSAALVEQALLIAEELRRRALPTPGGGLSWLGLEDAPGSAWPRVARLGPDLYSGTGGVALFLAGLARVTGDRRWRALGRAALEPICMGLRDGGFADGPIGGATGLGSLIYVLSTAAGMLAAPELLHVARQAAALLTPKRIAADRAFDVVDGAAGAMLGLLAFAQAAGDDGWLARARLCGAHLLDHQVAVAGGRAWVGPLGLPLTGFAHGAAGIAYSLLRLYTADRDERWRAAATAAIAYERALFSADHGNWPDLREQPPAFLYRWCHGAAGIGLARLGGLVAHDHPAVRAEIAAALAAHATDDAGHDHLCCGRCGRIELLLVAGKRLGQPALHDQARQQAAHMAATARGAGCYRLFAEIPGDGYHPGFFRGMAGIGYTLLRAAQVGHLPCIALWELPQ